MNDATQMMNRRRRARLQAEASSPRASTFGLPFVPGISPFLTALVFVLVTTATSHADTYHTPLDRSNPGGIVGVVTPTEGLQTVIAIEPTEIKAYQAALDTETGRFELRGLPPGEYDLFIKYTGGVVEGVSLQPDPEAVSSPKERKALLDEVKPLLEGMEDYFHIKYVVRLDGTPEQMRVLLMQLRTRPTLDPGGNTIPASIRRFDFVDIIKNGKVWQISTNRHVLRQEVPHGSRDEKLSYAHSPALGGILVGEGVRDMGVLDLAKLPKTPAGEYPSAELKAPR